MRAEKQKTEMVVYIITSLLTIAGTALCLVGLLLPYWYTSIILEGIVDVGTANLGLWQDQYCAKNSSCQSTWMSAGSHARPEYMEFPSWMVIQGIETAGAVAAVLSVVSLAPFWAVFRSNNSFVRNTIYGIFFVTSLVASFLSVIGCLVIASVGSNAHIRKVDFAPFFSGIGGTVIFIALGVACTICRYDPTYGTLENPVSPKFSRA
ncbi:unnamed protein product [Candidula unifasciata]|uniref:Uncharacterized protein n=1 Tax=Candidula unifasciata TaxID=100452 RepID=A0A8S3YRK8_9EUPU|nr:unnamed protein product [Candidula unifasciata]